MYDALEADDGEEPGAETGQPGQEEDGEGEQRLPARRLRQAPRQAAPARWGPSAGHRRRGASAVDQRLGAGGRVRRRGAGRRGGGGRGGGTGLVLVVVG